ncbi:hypothetical protein [Sinomicrobium sp. M5D2P9]
MKKEIELINSLVIKGILPAPFYDALIIERKKQDNYFERDNYSEKYKQSFLTEPPFRHISKI